MTESPTVHLRFIGGVIYCGAVKRRVSLGPQHEYGAAFTCPFCGHEEPSRRKADR